VAPRKSAGSRQPRRQHQPRRGARRSPLHRNTRRPVKTGRPASLTGRSGAEEGDRGPSQSRPLLRQTANQTIVSAMLAGIHDAHLAKMRRYKDLTSRRARAAGGGLCRPCCPADWDRSRNRGVSDPGTLFAGRLQLRPRGRSRPGCRCRCRVAFEVSLLGRIMHGGAHCRGIAACHFECPKGVHGTGDDAWHLRKR
jgi:hypothetical protein